MSEHDTYEITAVSQALSPLTHNSGTAGNETLVNTESVQTPEGKQRVPMLSGNAIRTRMVRHPGMDYLVEQYDLRGHLSIESVQFLFSGGSRSKSGQSENTARVRRLWEALPLLYVLGSCLPDQMLPGHLDSWQGTLVCRENLHRLREMLPGDWLPKGRYLSAHRLIDRYQYTRVDPTVKHARDLAEGDEVSTQMIYGGETVRAGSVFVHGWCLRNALPRDLGALLWSIELWNRRCKTMGGMAAKGHGRLMTLLRVEPETDRDGVMETYRQYVADHRDEARQALAEEFDLQGVT